MSFIVQQIRRFKRKLYALYPKLYKIHNGSKLVIGENTVFKGLPIIQICDGAHVSIGDKVILNSINMGYHISLYSPIKIMADRKGAIIEIGDETRIHGSCLHAYMKISIGKRCLIGGNCNIIDGSGHDLAFDRIEERHKTTGDAKEVIIEDDVWIGANTIVLPGTRIGYGSVISAGSVVRGKFLPLCLLAGNPAQIVKKYEIGDVPNTADRCSENY